MPYKATINMDQDDWTEFVNICKSLDSTASKEVRGFIEAFKQGKVYDHANLDKSVKKQDIDRNSDDLIAEKVIAKLRPDLEWIGSAISGQAEEYRVLNTIITKELKTDAKAVLSFVPEKVSKRKAKNIETDIKTDKKTDKEKATTTTESGQIDESNELATSNIVTEDIKSTEPLEDWARTVYTDKEVAEIEGINKATVNKRRTGRLKSRGSDFWDRWELSSLNSNRWWRKQKVKSSEFESK